VPSHYGAAPAAFLDLLARIRPPAGFTEAYRYWYRVGA